MTRNRLPACTFGLVTLAAIVNAMEPWGEAAALRAEPIIQLTVAVGTLVVGLVSAARVSGMSRWWRLAYVASLSFFLLTQYLRSTDSVGVGDRAADFVVIAAFVMCPALALVALVLLGRSGRSGDAPHRVPMRQTVTINVLDGLVASLAFFTLAAMGGFVHQLTDAPQVGTVALQVVLMLGELLVVGTAVVMVMLFDMDRPFRTNYLFLAGGMVVMAASYRVVVYLNSIGAEHGALWVGVGFTVGLLMIGYAMLDVAPRQAPPARENRRVDWPHLILPYSGFLGIAILFAFHVFLGRPLGLVAVCAAVVMVSLVTVRQVVAMRAQWLLTGRLYWALGHDPLTGLPNRILFAQLLDEAVRDRRFVLIFIDLDDFSEVNVQYGHAAGDELLRAVAKRLQACISDNDTLARIGGDEFAVLYRGDAEQLDVAADRLRVALREPFPVSGSSVRVRASMGVVGPEEASPGQTSDDLLRYADMSVFAGKQHGKDTAVIYHASTGPRVEFPRALRDANGAVPPGFRLVYQKIVTLPEGRPVAMEALARWTSPSGVGVPPETFVGAAEAAGLGAALDALVLDRACAELASAGVDLDIHVNVGAARLGSTGFDENVRRTLERHGIEPSRLVLEITETVPIVDIADAAAHIGRLNTLGVRTALDDFGAGYNSLTYLHSLPVRIVKLDRSLVVGVDLDRDLSLYRSVVGLCADLGLIVVAEGIETQHQAQTVQAAGCRFAQGYLFGRPVPIDEVDEDRLGELRR